MGRLTPSQLVSFQRPAVVAVPLVEVDLPSGETASITFSGLPASSASLGYYYPMMLSLTDLEIKLDVATSRMFMPELRAVVSDAPERGDSVGWLSRIAATYGPALRNAPVRIRAASSVDSGDWALLYSGRLVDWSKSGRESRTLVLRPLDADLQADFWQPVVRGDHFSNAPQENINKPIPIVYGECSDRGGQGEMRGHVPAVYVDNVGFRYCPCFGWATAGKDVFVGGALQASGYTWVFEETQGVRYTLIDFAADKGTSPVTCNIHGVETIGDRTGTLIRETPAQMLHFLVNHVFRRSQLGAWTQDLTGLPVNAASFDAVSVALLDRAGGADYVGSRWIAGAKKALTTFEEGCDSCGAMPYWDFSGRVALAYDDPHLEPSPSVTYRGGRGLISIDCEEGDQRVAVKVQVITWAEDGTVSGEVSLRDLLSPGTATHRLATPWGPPASR